MSARTSVAWSVGAQIGAFVTSFAGTLITARLLSPRDMGVYAASAAVVGLLSITATFGVQTYVVREEALDQAAVASAFTVNAILCTLITACILVASTFHVLFLQDPNVVRVMRCLSLIPLIGVLEFLPASMTTRHMGFKLISIVLVAKTAAGSMIGVCFAMLHYGAISLAFGNIAAAVTSALILNVAGRQHVSFRISFLRARSITGFGLQMMAVGGIAALSARLSEIVIGRQLGLEALGLYARASSIYDLIFYNVYNLGARVLFVKMAEDLRQRGSLRESYLVGMAMLTAVMWPILLGLAVLAGPVISLLYGEQWVGAALPLSLLMVAQAVVLSFGMNWELFVLRGETGRQIKFEAVRAIVGFSLLCVGSLFGIAAACASRIGEAACGWALYRPRIDRLVGTQRGEIDALYRRSLLLACAAVWPALTLMLATGWSTRIALPLVALAVVAGITCWLAVLHWLAHPLMAEIARTAGLLRGRFGQSVGKLHASLTVAAAVAQQDDHGGPCTSLREDIPVDDLTLGTSTMDGDKPARGADTVRA